MQILLTSVLGARGLSGEVVMGHAPVRHGGSGSDRDIRLDEQELSQYRSHLARSLQALARDDLAAARRHLDQALQSRAGDLAVESARSGPFPAAVPRSPFGRWLVGLGPR